MNDPLPGPSARLAEMLPVHGPATIGGLQPLDSDGTLLRGQRADARPLPRGSRGRVIRIESAPAGCVVSAAVVEDVGGHLQMPCGLIPGASGGGLYVERDGQLFLGGVISTVALDLSFNGLAPVESIQRLLNDQPRYTADVPSPSLTGARQPVNRS